MAECALAAAKKNATRRRAWLVFVDESGFSLLPSVRATWAPKGQTPLLRHQFRHWVRASAVTAVGYRWDGQRARLYFHTKIGAYNDEALIRFLRQLRRAFRGQPVILLWDGLPSHRSATMGTFRAGQRTWLRVERLPAYAPDLNPAEGVWANLKSTELANRCEASIEVTQLVAEDGMKRIRSSQQLLFSFLGQTGLSF